MVPSKFTKQEYHLVQYTDDGIWRVCPKKDVKKVNEQFLAKWPQNGIFYPVQIYGIGDKKSLEKIKKINELEQKQTSDTQDSDSSFTQDKKQMENVTHEVDANNDAITKLEVKNSKTRSIEKVSVIVTNIQQNSGACDYDMDEGSEKEPYGSNSSEEDPDFVPDEEEAEDCGANSESSNDSPQIVKHNKLESASMSNDDEDKLETLPKNYKPCNKDECAALIIDTINSSSIPMEENSLNPTIPMSNAGAKQYFCIFCKQLFSKLPAHLERKHQSEELVKRFKILPKGSIERKEIINDLRKQGSYLFNTNGTYNKGHLITARRARCENRSLSDFRICPYCKGTFSKYTIRKHYKNCIPLYRKGDRHISVLSKRVHGRVHKSACYVLRNQIFPKMRDDSVTNAVRYDTLAIHYGNSLCEKYRLEHLHKMIRGKLRLVGRFILKVREIDDRINEFSDVFHPEYTDNVIKAIHEIAGLKESTQEYKAPATAADLGTTLKKCAKRLVSICIKTKKFDQKEDVENFLKVFEEDLTNAVNKTVSESQLLQKRRQTIQLPSTTDINKLYSYVEKGMFVSFTKLNDEFSVEIWKQLASHTLTVIQIFNRRRAGELERMYIEDFKTYTAFDKTDVSSHKLVNDNISDAQNYVRFVIRGKKARGVPVLLTQDMLKSVLLILEKRELAGVSEENPYVFGLEGKNKHLDACKLMRDFSEKCDADNPVLLRGTSLRKHLATKSGTLNLNDGQVNDLANFMGHELKIHREHYRLCLPERDAGEISQLLQIGIGRNTTTSLSTSNAFGHLDSDSENLENENPSSGNEKKRDSWNTSRNETDYGRQRCVSPAGVVNRTSWNTYEIQDASTLFSEHILNQTIPSREECLKAIENYETLRRRTVSQIKGWVSNQHKKKNRRHCTQRSYWSQEEKNVMYTVFDKHLRDQLLPGERLCTEIQKKYPELSQRTAKQIKAWINNTIRKNNK